MPALHELQNDGSVDRAENWSALKTEVTQKLAEYGAESSAGTLVAPLDGAVEDGADYKELIAELNVEYQAAADEQPPDDETELAKQPPDDETELAKQPADDETELAKQPPDDETQLAKQPADDETTEFTAGLPDETELAEQIVMDLGREISALIAANPELAKVSDEELMAWVIEDMEAAINEIAEAGWVV